MTTIYPVGYADERAALIKRIDADTDVIYQSVQGNRGAEYLLAESDANNFKASGYAGAAPSSVKSWADAKGWTTTQAADDIIATANAWRGAQAQIRATRLMLKEQAKNGADVGSIKSQWDSFFAAIKSALGL